MLTKTIQEIYSPRVFHVTPSTPAHTTMMRMRDKNVSCIVVVEQEQPVGIFTERDVVRCIASQGLGFAENPMSEVMTPHVHTVNLETPLFEAFGILAENTIRHLVVVDKDNRAVGVTTQSDMIDHFGYEYFVKVRTVHQVMNCHIVTAPPDMTVYKAAESMARHEISFLVCCMDFMPEGVLTERDVSRLVADGVDISKTKIGEVMSSPVITIGEDQSAYEATKALSENGIRRLVVVDKEGIVKGVLTQTDMVRGLESKYIDTLKRIIKEQGSELDQAIHQLAKKTLYLDSILSSSISMGIVATDRNLRISYFNAAAQEVLGVPAANVLGKDLMAIHDRRKVGSERLEKAFALARNNEPHSFAMTREDKGAVKYIQARVSGIFDKHSLIGYLLIVEDVTEKRKAEETIQKLAYFDVLTGLPNRALFYEHLNANLARARRNKERLGVLLMDIDRFKQVNDEHGHYVGDLLLKAVGQRLRNCVRESDTVARVGGDEICFLLIDNNSLEDVFTVGTKILERLQPEYDLGGVRLDVRFSMGVAMYPGDGEDPDSLIRLADKAMYAAKKYGRTNAQSNICHVKEVEEPICRQP